MSQQRLIKDTLLTLITLVIFGSTNFIFNVVVGRVYGSAYLGLVSTALSTSLLLSYVVSTSFPGAVSKYVSEYLGRKREKDADYVFKLALKYGLIIASIMTLFALIFSDFLCSLFNMSKEVFLLSVPLIILYGLYMILKMAYYGYRNVKKYFHNEIVADSLFFITLTLLIIFHWKAYIFLPYIALYSFFILSALHFFRHRLKSLPSSGSAEISKKFFTFAGISFVGTFSSMSMRSLSIMISSAYVSPSEVGYLSAAFSLSAIFFLFPNAIGRVLMPEFSYTYGEGDKEKMVRLLNKSTEYLAVFVTIINALGIIFAGLLVWIFFGNEFFTSVLLLQLALFLYWPSMVGRSVLSILSGTRYVHIPNIISVFGLLFSLLLWILLIPMWGVVGTMVGYLIESWIAMSFTFYFGYRFFKFNNKIIAKHIPWLLSILILSLPLSTFSIYWRTILSSLVLIVYVITQKKIIVSFINKLQILHK